MLALTAPVGCSFVSVAEACSVGLHLIRQIQLSEQCRKLNVPMCRSFEALAEVLFQLSLIEQHVHICIEAASLTFQLSHLIHIAGL